MVNRIHLTMDAGLVSALTWAGQELRIAKRHLICRAVGVWAMNPTLKPWQPEGKGVHAHVSVAMSREDAAMIRAWCAEFDAKPSQVVSSALSYWFEDCRFLDRVQSGEISTIEREQISRASKRTPLVPQEPEEPLEQILQQQLAFYQRRGNPLRVAQIQRQLRQLEAAA